MSLPKTSACLAALVAVAMLASQATAQHEIHHVPPVIDGDGNNPDFLHPFVDVTAFPHDFQFFAPPEFGEFGDGPELNWGWFAAANRLYWYQSRPEEEQSFAEGDFGWGNRFTVGYMSEEDHGWFGEFIHFDGPHASFVIEAERVNVLNEDDEINGNPDNVNLRDGGGQQQQQQQMMGAPNFGVPESDQNNPISEDRRYLLQDSLNVADLSSWELNKSLRLKKLHYGSILEPFFGFRYIKYQDYALFDQYQRFDDMGSLITTIPGVFAPTDVDTALLQTELLTSTRGLNDNHLVGGQFGARWYRYKGRWNLSGEIRAFLFHNFQAQNLNVFRELTFYDGAGVGVDVLLVQEDNQHTYLNATEFVFGGEVRAEAAFEVTRDINLKFGMNFMELGKGIQRGFDFVDNSENVTMVGWTFGVDFRR